MSAADATVTNPPDVKTTSLPRILVLSPAGQVYQKDCVRWYEQPREQVISNYFNIGDMVVYDSTLKMLDFAEVRGVVIDKIVEKEIEAYNNGYDYFIIRASNFIHNDMDWLEAISVLERVPLPIYAIGVGAQSSGKGTYKLTGKNLRFWKMVSERSNVIGVRGTYTADVLSASGIKNVEVVGCPSMFRSRRRDLNLKAPTGDLRRVAFSIRREADGTYAADVARYRAIQRDFLLNVAAHFDTTVTIHGEPEEKAFFFQDEQGMNNARQVFRHEGWFSPETEEQMERLYQEHLFFFLKVEEYDQFIRTQDFALGYRVHGVLPALSNGVPGVLVRYDSRSGELADTHAIPSIELKSTDRVDIHDLIRNVDFSEFNRIHRLRYDKMRFVLDYNNMKHRL
ncbi:polysaccharide pyruvyl transferase family protein [Sabulicella glaciei]|uniref:Polysaccharide pyruvyl transferase family protein n=1 Tax=Sabulicella glaciei TaxID=2984948 RepID=A0ABT3NSG5_9PROT|nr:polysaccharide pyruvyl transferase family protein [Roseococcus sp. MDT2-1-1]MCW8085098.1 polysaccharide pyruvyl transferase family protein [Roseococcus sp. MDT2-1-1]